jgi:DNA primase
MVPETPEARAALEAKLRARANAIADASVRRHYLQAFDEKLQAFFAPVRQNRYEGRRDGGRSQYGVRARGTPRLVVSDTLRNSRLLKPGRMPEATPREAAIILTLVNHPSLAEDRIEALAALEFSSPTVRGLMTTLLDLVIRDHDLTAADLAVALGARGFGEALERMRGQLMGLGVWQIGAEIAEADAETGLKHALALHNKKVQLNRDLREAEKALGMDPSEETFERLRDIQNQITTVDGTEALIEGYGSLSGRATRSF